MVLLKEDGSLDVERMNNLPLEEWIEEMETLTENQVEEYISKLPVNESKEPVQPVVVDYTLKEELERGSVIAGDFINKLRKRHSIK